MPADPKDGRSETGVQPKPASWYKRLRVENASLRELNRQLSGQVEAVKTQRRGSSRGTAMRDREAILADLAIFGGTSTYTAADNAIDRLLDDVPDLLAAIERVEALADDAERQQHESLARTFGGGYFPAAVDVFRLRAALTGDQDGAGA